MSSPATRSRPAPAIKSESGTRYYARMPFGYAGTDLHRGQVFTLTGAPNDEKLVRLRYCAEVEKHHQTYHCDECGADFVELHFREAHGKLAHRRRDRTLTPLEEDAREEQEEKRLVREAPLALENTKASREA